MNRNYIFRSLWVFAICALSHTSVHALTDSEVDARSHEISRTVLSPFCPGRMLSDCPSSAASELKESVRNRILAGESNAQILDSLYATYGDDIRSTPAGHGVGILAWAAPALFLLVGALSVGWWLFMMRAIIAKEESPRLDPKTRREVEKALMKDEQMTP